jgi:hypothetical protein
VEDVAIALQEALDIDPFNVLPAIKCADRVTN